MRAAGLRTYGLRALCFAALMAGLAVGACGPKGDGDDPAGEGESAAKGEGRSLVILMIDTLRADALVARDGQPPAAARLAALGRKGVNFRSAVSTAPWTAPAMTSMLTGLLPSSHGVNEPDAEPKLLTSVPTYAERLAEEHGYETAAFLGGPWLVSAPSIFRGFEHQQDKWTLSQMQDTVVPFLAERDTSKPCFLLFHTYEVHDPFGAENHPWPPKDGNVEAAPLPWSELPEHDGPIFDQWIASNRARKSLYAIGAASIVERMMTYINTGWRTDPDTGRIARAEALYWEAVREMDAQIDAFHEALRAAPGMEDALLVIVADHGEAFGEHDIVMHGRRLWDEVIHIPMIFEGPRPFDRGIELPGAASLADVVPTFLDWTGLEAQPGAYGRSLLPMIEWRNAEEARGRPVHAEERNDIRSLGSDEEEQVYGVRDARWTYVLTCDLKRGGFREELYDRLEDPGELQNLAHPTGARRLDLDMCLAIYTSRRRAFENVYGSPQPPSDQSPFVLPFAEPTR